MHFIILPLVSYRVQLSILLFVVTMEKSEEWLQVDLGVAILAPCAAATILEPGGLPVLSNTRCKAGQCPVSAFLAAQLGYT